MARPALLLALLCASTLLAGCPRRGPAPAYPSPQDPPLEDTDLARFLEQDAGAEHDGGTTPPESAPEGIDAP